MRTTLTLDPDVDHLLRRAMRERGSSFRETVNDALRAGLRPHKAPAFRQKTVSLGLHPGTNWDKALAIASQLEDETILRKMARDK